MPGRREASPLRRVEEPDGLVVLRSPSLEELGVPHLFTTRRGPGGVALDAGPGPLPAGLAGRLATLAGAPGARPAGVRQVHGADVVALEADAEPPSGTPGTSCGALPEGDALVTGRPDRLLVVRTADCVPVLVAAAGGARVAAVHAGWRGLVAGVLPRALARLEVAPGGPPPVAAIGPCLSTRRFEVGPEVAAAFAAAGLGAAVHPASAGGRPRVDLRAAALLQLHAGGVERVDVARECTWESDELWSYRRDVTHGGRRATGRLAALVAPAR